MNAKKCDRCGKLYEYEEPKLTKIGKIGKIDTYGIAWELHCYNCFIDLCPDCLNDFKKWFEMR